MRNEVYNMDCMVYMAGLPDNAYDLAIVDPPYFDKDKNDNFYHGGKSKYANFVNTKRNNYWEIPDINYYKDLCRITKHQIIWGINYFNFGKISAGRIFWFKNNLNSTFSDGEIAFCSLIESVKYFEYTWDGFRQGKNNKHKEKRIHKTQKPVALYKWLLKNYAKPGQTIFDSHVGSGSIRIACHDMGFDFVGCELDPDYWQAQEDRYKQHIANASLPGMEPEYIQDHIYEQELF